MQLPLWFLMLILFNIPSALSQNEAPKSEVKKVYYSDGTLEQEISMVNGKRNGITKEYNQKGKLKAEMNYVENKLHGERKEWWSDGSIHSEEYADGKRTGSWKEYDAEGKLLQAYDAVSKDTLKVKYQGGRLEKEIIKHLDDTITVKIYDRKGKFRQEEIKFPEQVEMVGIPEQTGPCDVDKCYRSDLTEQEKKINKLVISRRGNDIYWQSQGNKLLRQGETTESRAYLINDDGDGWIEIATVEGKDTWLENPFGVAWSQWTHDTGETYCIYKEHRKKSKEFFMGTCDAKQFKALIRDV